MRLFMMSFALCAGAAAPFFSLPCLAAAESGTVTVVLNGVEPERGGHLGCALYSSEKGFPSETKNAVANVSAVGKGNKRTCTFTVNAEGNYAVAVLHDEDGDRKLDTNLFGVPKEGWATSNNVTHTFRAPNWDESKFVVKNPKTTVSLSMHY
ncbi:MAG: DUF2141 domain-containing protein [Myxococcota bacterium]